MTNIDKIRELLKDAITKIEEGITWAKYPDEIVSYSDNALDYLTEALSLLPCETCETCEGLRQIVVPRKIIPGVDWEPCPDCKGDLE